MADPAGLATPRFIAFVVTALAVVAAALALTVGYWQPATSAANMSEFVATECRGISSTTPALCAALVQRGWVIVRVGDTVRLVPPSGSR